MINLHDLSGEARAAARRLRAGGEGGRAGRAARPSSVAPSPWPSAVALEQAGADVESQRVSSLLSGLDLAHAGEVHVEEFIAAAVDQRRVLTAKTINSIFCELRARGCLCTPYLVVCTPPAPLTPLALPGRRTAELDTDNDGFLGVEELSAALDECHVSVGAETLERLMRREGALDRRGMISARSFHVRRRRVDGAGWGAGCGWQRHRPEALIVSLHRSLSHRRC